MNQECFIQASTQANRKLLRECFYMSQLLSLDKDLGSRRWYQRLPKFCMGSQQKCYDSKNYGIINSHWVVFEYNDVKFWE